MPKLLKIGTGGRASIDGVVNTEENIYTQLQADTTFDAKKQASRSANAAAGNVRDYTFTTADSIRWRIRVDGSAESGGNAGSNFLIARFDDTSNRIDDVISINRATGVIQVVTPSLGDNSKQIATTEFVNKFQGKGSSKFISIGTTLILNDYGKNGNLTIYADATAGAFTITLLPSATDQGLTTKIVKVDSSANTVSVKGSGTELINNANTDTTLSTQNASFILESNGTKHFKF